MKETPNSLQVEFQFGQGMAKKDETKLKQSGIPTTLAFDGDQFFLGQGKDGEIYLNSAKPVTIAEALEWYADVDPGEGCTYGDISQLAKAAADQLRASAN